MNSNGHIRIPDNQSENDIPRLAHALQHAQDGEFHIVLCDSENTEKMALKTLIPLLDQQAKILTYKSTPKNKTFLKKVCDSAQTQITLIKNLYEIEANNSDGHSEEALRMFDNEMKSARLKKPVVLFFPIQALTFVEEFVSHIWQHRAGLYLFEEPDLDRFRRGFYLVDYFSDTQQCRFYSEKQQMLALYKLLLKEYHKPQFENELLLKFSIFGKFANLHFKLGDFPQAYFYMKRQKELLRLLRDSKLLPEILNNIGLLNHTLSKYDEALECYDNAQKIAEKNLRGSNHPAKTVILSNMGELSYERGDYIDAFVKTRKALRMAEAKFGTRHEFLVPLLIKFARTCRIRGDYADALDHYRRSLRIVENKLKIDHPYMSVILEQIGMTYYFQKKYDIAQRYVYRTLEPLEHAMGPAHPYLGLLLNNVGVTHFYSESSDRALKYYRWALDIRMDKIGENDVVVGYIYDNIGRIYRAQGDREKARIFSKKAEKILKNHHLQNHAEDASDGKNIQDLTSEPAAQ